MASDQLKFGWFALAVLACALPLSAFSAEGDSVSADSTQKTEKSNKAKGGKRTREKDADGTEAPDRFEADTVIKSPYKLNGQPLEVDPD